MEHGLANVRELYLMKAETTFSMEHRLAKVT